MLRKIGKGRFALLATALILVPCAAWALQAHLKLTMNNSLVSTDVRVIDGSAWVKVADVAKALDMVVVKKDDGYELIRAGGANQINGLKGRVGDIIFTGKWLFTVKSVEKVDEYIQKYDPDKNTISPKGADDTLVVVTFRVKNGTKVKQELFFWMSLSENTALTDDAEHSYPPLAYDSRNSDITGDMLLPGAAKDWAVVFSVPKDARLKDLIYTISAKDIDNTDMRISLKP